MYLVVNSNPLIANSLTAVAFFIPLVAAYCSISSNSSLLKLTSHLYAVK